ncbi:MAG: 2-polyprenylphenol 6-hydroxylase, partial [Rhodobacteraceae bacterium]|nr:2-polyprenylphenol 6-hydroxylase [Paracoccaceae bacterium]
RFGMETRTELILLQRTMVVVEGVGRTLDSDLNIWECARPIVENYIRRHVGPAATLREFAETARMLSRLGPRLPQLAETAIRNLEKDTDEPPASRQLKWFALGVLTAIAVTALVMLIDFG